MEKKIIEKIFIAKKNNVEFDCITRLDLEKIFSEMWGEFPKLKSLEEMKEYILTHCVRFDDGTPIFSSRYFAEILDKEIETRKKWSEDERHLPQENNKD